MSISFRSQIEHLTCWLDLDDRIILVFIINKTLKGLNEMKNKGILPISLSIISIILVIAVALMGCGQQKAVETTSLEGKYTYDDFTTPSICGTCHQEIYQEWQQMMMSQCFVHEWDDVEYFQLALPQALELEKVSGVKSGCVACHGPLAYLAGDIPPSPPSAGTRVNEGVSCDVCHSITGSSQEVPYNFSYIMDVGDTKYGPRDDAVSSFHQTQYSDFIVSPEICANCHDEQSPYDAWVKETYREWQAGPYSDEGTICQDCHMDFAAGTSAIGGQQRADIAHHTFLGAHFVERLDGTVEITLSSDRQQASAGDSITIDAELYNALCGHYFPSGSTEERVLWLEVWATDSSGNSYNIPVVSKGFEGEEYTIADSTAIAYSDIGEIIGIAGFEGLSRDGNVPDGARIFRRPFFNPEGEMTICQWYTESNTLVDYRFAPRETKMETYSWLIPDGITSGTLTIEATLYYSLVPSSIGEFFELPETEYQAKVVDSQSLTIEIN
jgi:hypothetical protein